MKTAEALAIVKTTWEKQGAHHPSRDGRALFMYKEISNFRFHLSFSCTERFDGFGLSFGCSFITNKLGIAVNAIDQKQHRVFPFKNREWQFYQVSDEEIGTLADLVIKEAETWIQAAKFEPHLEWLTSTLVHPGSHQLWHLAALAAVGDSTTLMRYLSSLALSDRGGLFPFITKEHIERAIAHAGTGRRI
jgi:hypothetical protein